MLIGIDGNEANVAKRVGSNQYAFELLQALSKIETLHQFLVFLREKPLPDMPSRKKNWSYKVFGPKRFWTRWRLPLELYFGRPRPEIFFSPGHYGPLFLPMPLVCSIMDLGFLKFPDQFTRKDFLQLSSWTKKSIQKASHLFAISQATKDDIIKEFQVPEEKITVTYPGYDWKRFNLQINQEKIDAVRKKYKIENGYILFLSTLKPSKNIERLISAFKKANLGNLKLVIAGKKGWLYDTIFSKVKELAVVDKVVFTDFVPDEDVSALMAGAQVFVLPSFWEGFGIPVLEAMACGVPVVVSQLGSLPEVVGKSGITVNPYSEESIASGIKRALENKNKMSKLGLEQVKKFSWETCAKKTLETLLNI